MTVDICNCSVISTFFYNVGSDNRFAIFICYYTFYYILFLCNRLGNQTCLGSLFNRIDQDKIVFRNFIFDSFFFKYLFQNRFYCLIFYMDRNSFIQVYFFTFIDETIARLIFNKEKDFLYRLVFLLPAITLFPVNRRLLISEVKTGSKAILLIS